jgi:pyridoxamine 5'-phosphate oxidase
MQNKIADLRLDYKMQSLDIQDVSEKPIEQFNNWFQEALQSDLREPNAMVVATVDKNNMPNARVVLLKGVSERGFVFFTNFESKKGQELLQNPKAALVFNWLELERQIRIQGTVEKISEEESIAYFQSRPKGSQIGAWVSPQSQVIENRFILEAKQNELEAKFEKESILPKPANWGGYRVVPQTIEFWQGRSSRLHDRVFYTLQNDGSWTIERLAP